MPSCAFQRRPAGRRVRAEHPHLAGVAAAVALEHLDRRRLAGAVGAEQREDLAAADVEVQPVDGGGVAVALDQPPDRDRRLGVQGPRLGTPAQRRGRGRTGHGHPVSPPTPIPRPLPNRSRGDLRRRLALRR